MKTKYDMHPSEWCYICERPNTLCSHNKPQPGPIELTTPPKFEAFSIAGVAELTEQLGDMYNHILQSMERLLNETFGTVVHEIVMEGKHCFDVSPVMSSPGFLIPERKAYYVTTPSELRSALAHAMTGSNRSFIHIAPELRKILTEGSIPGVKITGPEQIDRLVDNANDLCYYCGCTMGTHRSDCLDLFRGAGNARRPLLMHEPKIKPGVMPDLCDTCKLPVWHCECKATT